MLSRVAFMSTIFPLSEKYLHDFFNSLSMQTYSNFDLVIVNDGYKYIDKFIKEYDCLNIIEIKCSDTPAKNREYGINYCINEGYDILIFGDSDDYFEKNRVEKSIELLMHYDIVVNDLSLFNESGIYESMYISHRLNNMSIVSYDFIKDKNIFGLSNTGIRLKNISKADFDRDIVAVDWVLYKKLLRDGCKAIFTNETVTYYRQYIGNTIGLKVDGNRYLLWWED